MILLNLIIIGNSTAVPCSSLDMGQKYFTRYSVQNKHSGGHKPACLKGLYNIFRCFLIRILLVIICLTEGAVGNGIDRGPPTEHSPMLQDANMSPESRASSNNGHTPNPR